MQTTISITDLVLHPFIFPARSLSQRGGICLKIHGRIYRGYMEGVLSNRIDRPSTKETNGKSCANKSYILAFPTLFELLLWSGKLKLENHTSIDLCVHTSSCDSWLLEGGDEHSTCDKSSCHSCTCLPIL